jgi:hypothetical protein
MLSVRRFPWNVSFSDQTPRVSWNVFDQVCSFGLEVSDFKIATCILQG